MSLNKYMAGYGVAGIANSLTNPGNTLVTNTTRSWNGANRDFVPNCDLLNPVTNGECGAMANANFGKTIPGVTVDPSLLTGWGKRDFSSVSRAASGGTAVGARKRRMRGDSAVYD